MTTAEGLLKAGTFAHDALFYQGRDEYAREVCSFVRQGVSAGEPVLVAVPGRRLDLVRCALGEAGQAVSFADMAVLGRNPARIIPAIRRFADSRRPHRTRFVGEPVWAGRSPAETAEATRHEALINEALAAVPASALCPYDASALTTNVHRVGHAALGFGRPQRCWRSLRMRARSRRWAASTSGWRAWALRQRR